MSSKNVDRLSMLPEEILSHILSLMPTIFAVRTSILSKSWRYIWMFVTNLIFDDTYGDTFNRLDSLTKSVDGVLNLCKTSQIKLFRLHYCLPYGHKSSVSNWIDKIISLNVRELDLQVNLYQLPSSFFTCKTLTKLRLHHVVIGIVYVLESSYPYLVNLPCLEIVGSTFHFFNAFKVIKGCPMLESLSLEVTSCKKDEEDYILKIPTLKRLKLTCLESATPHNKVVLRVPNLEYLFVWGPSAPFVIEDVSSLVEASLSCRTMYCQPWADLSKGLNGIQYLSIQNMLLWPTTSPIFPNMKRLELKSSWHPKQVYQTLESCPELKHLYVGELYIYTHFIWIEPKSVPACMLTNFTTVNFSNCNGREYYISIYEIHVGECKGVEDGNNHFGMLNG